MRVPTAQSQPYGIVVNSEGVPFFVELTRTASAASIPGPWRFANALPHDDTMPRRIALTADDVG